MDTIKLLILDDDKTTHEGLFEAKNLFKHHTFEMVYFSTLKEALDSLNLDSSYDFAIIDLALSDGRGDEGNTFIDYLINKHNIYPIVFSGQPEKATCKTNFISKLTRGEHNSEDILNLVIKLFSTGITSLLGEDGTLQKHITSFYWDNLSRIYSSPEVLIKSGIKADSLTRLYLNYLHNDLVSTNEAEIRLHVDELYIIPQKETILVNGSIVKNEEHRFLVITPRCDISNSKSDNDKSVRYQLLKMSDIVPVIEDLRKCSADKRVALHDRIAQGQSEKRHYLPPSTNFEGGIIDFLEVSTCENKDAISFEIIGKVSNEMMRNITSRFASFYARQGQPIYSVNFDNIL